MKYELIVSYFCTQFSFPESEADALLLEVQDLKKSIQGRATIPISSLNDNAVRIFFLVFNIRYQKNKKCLQTYKFRSHLISNYAGWQNKVVASIP